MKTLNNNGEEKNQQEANRFLYTENDEERERGEIIPTAITVRKLSKSFKVREKRGGFIGNLKSLVSAKTKIVTAVDDISFTIKEGELVGFIGPNGAGKSTTIKMLSGILFPTKGSIRVLNYNPQEERIKLTQKIGTIFVLALTRDFRFPINPPRFSFTLKLLLSFLTVIAVGIISPLSLSSSFSLYKNLFASC